MAEKETKQSLLSQIPIWVWGSAGFLIFIVSVVFGFFLHCDYFGITSAENVRDVFLVFAAAIAAPFAIWRMTITNEQKEIEKQKEETDRQRKEISQQSLYTDSYIRAVGQLGATKTEKDQLLPNLETRVGAIFGLEKIGYESKEHAYQVLGVLSSYVRQNACQLRQFNYPRDDVYTALKSIARLMIKSRPSKNYMPNLHGVHLINTNLNGFDLKEFDFDNADLNRTHLEEAHLEKANLRWARLFYTYLTKADLQEARLEGTNLEEARLKEAKLGGASLVGAKMETAKGLERGQIESAFGDAATTLPPDLDKKRPKHWPERILNYPESYKKWQEWLKKKKQTDKMKMK